MIYDLTFGQQAACSSAERAECFPLVLRVYAYADRARKHGLLALESAIENESFFILKKGLALICDGEDPEVVRTVLERYIVAGHYCGKELLTRCIALEGIMAIHEARNPDTVLDLLVAFLGEEFSTEADRQVAEQWNGMIEEVKELPPIGTSGRELDQYLAALNDGEVKSLLQECDVDLIATAVAGASGKTQLRVLLGLRHRVARLALQEMMRVRNAGSGDMQAAQTKVRELATQVFD